MKWFRYFTSDLNDPIVQALPPHLFKFWVNALTLAGLRSGDLGTEKDIAAGLRCRLDHALKAVSVLHAYGLLDRINDRFTPRGWSRRQGATDQSAQRVRAFRERRRESARNGYNRVTETVPETAQNRTDSTSLLPYSVAAREEEVAQQGSKEDWASDALRELMQGRRH